MTGKLLYIFVLLSGGILVLSAGCNERKPVAAQKPEHTFTMKGSVREIKIQPETPDFPEHEGKAEFVSYCSMCHSLKYITAQPDLPRKAWQAEVTKMITKFKAPIDSATGNKIVDYIVAIKTKA